MDHCPICGYAKMTLFRHADGHDLVICKACRHVTWAELPKEQDLAEYYSNEYTRDHGQAKIQAEQASYYAGHTQELAAILGENIKDISIADIGCSYPTFLEEAVKQGAQKVFGVDWSQEARSYGEKVGVPVITPVEMEDAIADQSLDVLRYSHTLEHLPDPRLVLSQHIRKLRRGGLLYITQPNFPVFKLTESPVDIKDSVWPTHLHFFNPLSLQILLDRAGAKLIRIFTTAGESEAELVYRPIIDRVYAASRLKHMADLDDKTRGPLTAYPFFAGENVGIFASRKGGTLKTPHNQTQNRNPFARVSHVLKGFRRP